MPFIIGIVIFVVIVFAIALLSVYIPQEKKQKAIQAYTEKLGEIAKRAETSQLFADLVQRIQKEISERERGYVKYFDQKSISQIVGDSNNWAKNMAKSIFQIREDGLYDCKLPWYSDDTSTSRCIVKFSDLGYSNLTIVQIEALTVALGNAFENYTPSYRTDITIFHRETDSDRIAQFSQKVIDDPAHYSERMSSDTYRGEKKLLCNLCPTEKYLGSFVRNIIAEKEKIETAERERLKTPF